MIKLEDIIDLGSLQKLQDYFAEATGFAAITVDYQGNPLLRYSSFSPFCKKMRGNLDFYKKCIRSDAYASLEAVRNGTTCIHRCHAGLIDFAIPIIVEGEYIASMMCGQVRASDSLEGIEMALVPQERDYSGDCETSELYNAMPVVSFDKIRAAAIFFHTTISYIVNQYVLNKEKLELLEKQKEKIKLEKLGCGFKDRIGAINVSPYFYFNSLNAASTQAYLEGAVKAQEIMCVMGEVARFSMRNFGRAVPVRQELKNLENYLLIQKNRFGGRVSLHFDVKEDILRYAIPATILLIFVENAIAHGLERKSGPCNIKVDGRMEGCSLIFEIADDGAGMSNELIYRANDGSAFERDGNLGRGGIQNAREMLRFFFGSDFTLLFSANSRTDSGVMVSMSFPAR
ncbi:MAG: PocR ligand-binding domain-containing protein [Synergistaceae bacterium]|nr:PocR ligand-binding domain-containing protein [Synergistaceae bacterium]